MRIFYCEKCGIEVARIGTDTKKQAKEAIFALRRALYTDERVAKEIGVAPSTISRWARGLLDPTPDRLAPLLALADSCITPRDATTI